MLACSPWYVFPSCRTCPVYAVAQHAGRLHRHHSRAPGRADDDPLRSARGGAVERDGVAGTANRPSDQCTRSGIPENRGVKWPAIPSSARLWQRRHPSRLPCGALRAALTGPDSAAENHVLIGGNGGFGHGHKPDISRVNRSGHLHVLITGFSAQVRCRTCLPGLLPTCHRCRIPPKVRPNLIFVCKGVGNENEIR